MKRSIKTEPLKRKRGMSPLFGAPMVTFPLRLPVDELERLKKIAHRQNTTTTDLIRDSAMAIQEAVSDGTM
jgi:hypothetical protein